LLPRVGNTATEAEQEVAVNERRLAPLALRDDPAPGIDEDSLGEFSFLVRLDPLLPLSGCFLEILGTRSRSADSSPRGQGDADERYR